MRKSKLFKAFAVGCAISMTTATISGVQVSAMNNGAVGRSTQCSVELVGKISLPDKIVENKVEASKVKSATVRTKLYKKSYKNSDGIIYKKLTYKKPVLKGSSAAIKKINTYMESEKKRWVKESTQDLDTLKIQSAHSGITNKNIPYSTQTGTYTVMYNKKGYISFSIMDEYDCYDGRPGASYTYYTFNLNTGKRVSLGDVMKGNSSTIKSNVGKCFTKTKNQTKKEYSYLSNALSTVKSKVGKNFKKFCLTKDHICICIQEGEIADMASGLPEVGIPYSNTSYFKKNLK